MINTQTPNAACRNSDAGRLGKEIFVNRKEKYTALYLYSDPWMELEGKKGKYSYRTLILVSYSSGEGKGDIRARLANNVRGKESLGDCNDALYKGREFTRFYRHVLIRLGVKRGDILYFSARSDTLSGSK